MLKKSVIGIAGLRDINKLVDFFAPDATPQRRKLLVNRVLSVFGDDRGRLTPEALTELIQRHSNCVHDQQQKCPLLMYVRGMCWELNVFFGMDNEEDRAYRRYSEMTAARPLGSGHTEEEL